MSIFTAEPRTLLAYKGRTNRIGLDTGAVMGGMLTCAVLEEDRLGFITA